MEASFMIEIEGLPAAPGIGIAQLFFAPYQKRSIPEYRINKNDIASELRRFRKALDFVDDELRLLHETLTDSNAEKVEFIMAHRMILQDPILHDTIENWLSEKLYNIESLLFRFATGVEQTFRAMDNPLFAERSSDMQDVTHRVIDALLGHKRDDSLNRLKEDCIVVAYDLYPSDAVSLNPRYVKGIVAETGGVTSHIAILAGAFGIPAVLGVEDLLFKFHQESYSAGCLAIVDGDRGKVFFDPDERNLADYYLELEQRNVELQQHMSSLHPKVRSKDGKDVYLYANMGALGELNNPFLSSSSGIGLFRSEFLFLERIPSEEEQYQAYIQIMKSVDASQEVTIRTIDLGGDKVPVTGLLAESNPLLGCRAIRLAMAYPEELFRPQIRAIYRVAAYAAANGLAKIRVMLPMISSHLQLTRARAFIHETMECLRREGIYVPQIPIGAMIELPSAALCSDILAKDVDFFSIGTNDLIQYTLGIDRVNEKVGHLYDPLQFGVLKLIQMTIINANREGIPVSMCGEMASDPCATAILLGLKLRHFSMNTYSLPHISHAICNYNVSECEELASRYISMQNYELAYKYLLDWHKDRSIAIPISMWEKWN